MRISHGNGSRSSLGPFWLIVNCERPTETWNEYFDCRSNSRLDTIYAKCASAQGYAETGWGWSFLQPALVNEWDNVEGSLDDETCQYTFDIIF